MNDRLIASGKYIMNDQTRESISAVMDGESDELELRRLLKTLDTATEEEAEALLAQWQRHHLAGMAIRGELAGSTIAAPDFSAAVSAAIQNETVLAGDPVAPSATPAWRRFAVAATVALALVVAVQEYQSLDEQSELQIASDVVNDASSNGKHSAVGEPLRALQLASGSNSQPVLDEGSQATSQEQAAKAQQRLNEYILRHTNHAAQQSSQGIIPFARLANFEEE